MSTSEPAAGGIGHNKPSVTDILSDKHADLIEKVDDIAKRANEARSSLSETGEITTDEQLTQLVAIAVEAGKLSTTLDKTRLESTKPLREETEQHNKFFNALASRPDRIKDTFEGSINTYNRKLREKAARDAAETARQAQQEARRKLEQAATATGVMTDVLLDEAIEAEQRAKVATVGAQTAGKGPLKTEAGTVSTAAPWTHVVEDWSKIDLREIRDSFKVDEIEKAIRAHVRQHKNTKPLSGVRIFQDEQVRLRG